MIDWIETLHRLRGEQVEVVLITVAAVRGSAPRETGARMIVTPDHATGTIGGGQLEYRCTQIAAEHLRDDPASTRFWRRFPLGADLGQCCGGVVEVLFERIRAGDCRWFDTLHDLYLAREPVVMATMSDNKYLVTANSVFTSNEAESTDNVVLEARAMLKASNHVARSSIHNGEPTLFEPVTESCIDIAIFGAGHVGSACVAALSNIDCRIRWIDSRRNVFPETLPVRAMRVDSVHPALEVAAMPAGSYYLVMTHSHPLDYDICHRVLQRDDFAYCGLIGSRSKRNRFGRIMRDCDLPAAAMESLTCPIGVNGICGKRPEEIAIAVTAQILQVRDAGNLARGYDQDHLSLSVVSKSGRK